MQSHRQYKDATKSEADRIRRAGQAGLTSGLRKELVQLGIPATELRYMNDILNAALAFIAEVRQAREVCPSLPLFSLCQDGC